ncbi:MAG TPA: hypothetical protein VGS08_01815 [Candidatus Saccharimonadales bacterium]|nr:hypothetical protein [Candidatus Saccharimonadales bacterium]
MRPCVPTSTINALASIVGPGNGDGVPNYVFAPGFDRVITTTTGNQLWCAVSDEDVRITPEGNNKYEFYAAIDPENNDRLSLSIGNKDPESGARHPDIYPRLLVARSILYFEQLRGQNLTHLLGRWGDELAEPCFCDNWRQYLGKLATFGLGPHSYEQQVEAARSTWTGRVAWENGFTVIDGIDIEKSHAEGGEYVLVDFRRPVDCHQAA